VAGGVAALPEAFAVLPLKGEAATAELGADLARGARPGDVIALCGDLGAGKSSLARAFIHAFLEAPGLDVPSPTYTLVQAYGGSPPSIIHADLYRLADPSETAELGLDDAGGAIVLVEWPERAPALAARATLTVALDGLGAMRTARLSATPEAQARFARSLLIRSFLDTYGWAGAQRRHFTGDASARAYETVHLPGRDSAILMNAPRMPDGPPVHDGLPYSRVAHLAESITPFAAIDRALRDAGFAAPLIEAAALDDGLLLIEDLGRDGVIDKAGHPIAERYCAAAQLLADLHGVPWPKRCAVAPGVFHDVPDYSRRAMLVEAELFTRWYWPERLGAPPSAAVEAEWRAAWNAVLDAMPDDEPTLVLRDYHSPNLIWRPAETGNDRIGIIDFQDAVMGPAAYDVASLARDARVDIAPGLEAAVVDAYCARRAANGPFDRTRFLAGFAVMAAQRNAKILGIFHRLNRRDGKPAYLKHLPRIERYFARSLREPVMRPVAAMLSAHGVSFADTGA
jgi:N-acetylmuramate 1-kinase